MLCALVCTAVGVTGAPASAQSRELDQTAGRAELVSTPRVGALSLAGGWLLAPVDPDADPLSPPPSEVGAWRRVTLPASWRDLDLENEGAAVWLRRDVRLSADWRRLLAPSGLAVLFERPAAGRFDLWVRGRHRATFVAVESQGLPELRSVTLDSNAVADGGVVSLAVRLERAASSRSSPHDALPGPWASASIGDAVTLAERAELDTLRLRSESIAQFAFGALFGLFGLYQLFLGLWRRDRDALWLAATLLCAALASTVSTYAAAAALGPQLAERLFTAAMMACSAITLQFLWPFLGRPIPRLLRLYQATLVGWTVLVLAVPLPWFDAIRVVGWLWLIPMIVAFGHLVWREVWRGTLAGRFLAIGGTALVVALGVEVVLGVLGRQGEVALTSMAFTVFVGCLLAIQSGRYRRTQIELADMRLQLERMVEDRTAELSTANSQLEAEIAERKLAEQGMRMLESAVEQSIDGIAVAGLDGRMQYLNEAWAGMHGYEVFELLGYDWTIFHTPDQVREQLEPLLEAVRQEGAQEAEIDHRRRGGEPFPTWMSVTSLVGADAQPAGFVFIARDISERRKAEIERRRLESRVRRAERFESLGALAAGIAHDYNNALTGVLGNASLAAQELPEDSPILGRIRSIEESAERAAELTDQLLAYAGEEPTDVARVDLGALLQSRRDEFAGLLPERLIFDLHVKPDLPYVAVDRRLLLEAVRGLLSNAVEATPEGDGVVMLRAGSVEAQASTFEGAVYGEDAPPGRYAFFEVSDTGHGMDDEARARMFDPFFTTKTGGRGMGLATVMGIVRASRGAIKVYSRPQHGTTVEILLPASTEVPEAVPEVAAQTWRGSGAALVIDDEPLVLDVSAKVLQRSGFEPIAAPDGAAGLAAFDARRDEIQIVLVDLTMPGMDGETVLRELRERGSEIPVLLMSGYRPAAGDLQAGGFDGFLQKPFRPNDLTRKVREVMATS